VSQAEEVLKEYLDRLASLGQTILTADKSLSEAEQRTKGDTSIQVYYHYSTAIFQEVYLI